MKTRFAAVWLTPLLALGLASAPAAAAPPDVPDRIAYQGSLFDDTGAPRTGVVDLTVRLYDAAFSGTLLYKQIYLATPLTDGVFQIELGPTGEAADSPTNPLTTSLIDVFEGDLAGTAPGRFLQLTVGNDGALGRTPILASPFAMRAAVADDALSADVATNVLQLGAFPLEAFTEFYEHSNLDNSGPDNIDPSEGVADVDGDGIANFMDPDNDDDGLSDSTEVGQGSDINLVTPQVTGFTPPSGIAGQTTDVTVLGQHFEAGLSVAFGAENPTPANLTSTQFDVTVTSTPAGTRVVQVTVPNGETGSNAFTFNPPPPDHTIGVAPDAGIVLRMSSSNVPLIAGADEYGTLIDANPDIDEVSLVSDGGPAVAFGPGDVLYGLRCRSVGADCVVELMRDGDADLLLEAGEVVATLETIVGYNAVRLILDFDASGYAVAAYQVDGPPGTRAPRFARDLDGDDDFDGPGEFLVLPAVSGATTTSLDLAISPTGNAAFAHWNWNGGFSRVFHDRNGDGDFADTVGGNPETFSLAVGGTDSCTGIGFDPSGRLAVVSGGFSQPTDVWRDLNDDGDFADAGETLQLVASGGTGCDATSDSGGLAVVYHDGTDAKVVVDLNDDGDFADAGEETTLPASVNPNAELSVAIDAEGEIWAVSSDGRIFSNL